MVQPALRWISQHGEALTTLQAATAKVRASAAELGMTIEEWNRKFGI